MTLGRVRYSSRNALPKAVRSSQTGCQVERRTRWPAAGAWGRTEGTGTRVSASARSRVCSVLVRRESYTSEAGGSMVPADTVAGAACALTWPRRCDEASADQNPVKKTPITQAIKPNTEMNRATRIKSRAIT